MIEEHTAASTISDVAVAAAKLLHAARGRAPIRQRARFIAAPQEPIVAGAAVPGLILRLVLAHLQFKLSPYGFCEPARETTANPPTPVRPRTGFSTKPTILRSFLRGSTWEFDLSNGQKWTAPARIQAFVQEYGRDSTHGILPQSFDYNYVTGINVLPHLTYEVFIRGEAFTVQRPATIVTPSEPAPLR